VAEKIWFESSTGPRLAGLVDEPEGDVRGWGVFSHGFTLGKDSPAAARICRQLASEGIGMLRFDNLGLGESEGGWGDGSFTVKVDDTIRAVRWMADRGTPADLLIGHSFGGAAAIAAASEENGDDDPIKVNAVVSIGTPSNPAHVERQYEAVAQRAVEEGRAEWFVGGRALTIKRDFVEDVRRAHLLDRVTRLGVPLMVMHSPTDATVDVSSAAAIFNAALHPRSFVSLEGSDHLLTARGQAARAARIISAWADPYLASPSH